MTDPTRAFTLVASKPIGPREAAAASDLALRLAAELIRIIRVKKDDLERDVVVLDPGMLLERCLDPTHIHNSDALRTNHPRGSSLLTNRWSGSFLELLGFSGSYYGFAAMQDPKHASVLSLLQLGLFGVEVEMNHYIRQPGPNGEPSKLEAGVQRHGEMRLPNGELNPLLGLSGSYIVRYKVERPIRLMHVDFSSTSFIDMLDVIESKSKMKALLPENISLLKLIVGEETRLMHLLYRAVATAFHHQGHLLRIDGIVSSSLRAIHREGTRHAKVVCIWGKDGEVVQQLRPHTLSYFSFKGTIPKENRFPIGPGTDFAALRRQAME